MVISAVFEKNKLRRMCIRFLLRYVMWAYPVNQCMRDEKKAILGGFCSVEGDGDEHRRLAERRTDCGTDDGRGALTLTPQHATPNPRLSPSPIYRTENCKH